VSGTRLDPDELAALEDQRDHLLTSLEDLEREHDAGDLDDGDYRALKDDYTARAAEVLRAIDERRALMAAPRPPRSRARTVAVVVGVLAFAVAAGVLVARGSGERGGGTLTGNDGGLRVQLANCQPLAFQSPQRGIRCYRRILADTPDSHEALTYLGWAQVRTGDVAAGSRSLARAVELAPDYPDARVFRAVVLARAGEAARAAGDAEGARTAFLDAAEELDRFFRNDPPEVAVQVLAQELLEFKVFLGLLGPATAECWASSLTDRTGRLDQAFYDALRTCLDGVVAADPSAADARFTRALAALGPEGQDLAAARADVEAVLSDPGADAVATANARLLRASLGIVEAASTRLGRTSTRWTA
jgi:tetratricopeptide (TPR) repeat protein